VFHVFYHPQAPREAKTYAVEQVLPAQLQHLADALAGRAFLVGDAFTVADAYLVTALSWCLGTKTDLTRWPVVADYQARMLARPHVAQAFREERALWRRP
jgi:glutathione S-transferase